MMMDDPGVSKMQIKPYTSLRFACWVVWKEHQNIFLPNLCEIHGDFHPIPWDRIRKKKSPEQQTQETPLNLLCFVHTCNTISRKWVVSFPVLHIKFLLTSSFCACSKSTCQCFGEDPFLPQNLGPLQKA